MKLHELITEVKFTPSKPVADIIDDMINQNYSSLGSGNFSRIFQHPTKENIAVKVFVNDRGYAHYLRWVAAHQKNKYVPKIIPYEDGSIIKIYKNWRPEYRTQRIGIVNLRKLDRITNRGVIDKFAEYVMGFLDETARKSIIDKVRPDYHITVDRRFVILSKLKLPELLTIARNSKSSDPDLSELFTELARLFNKFRFIDFQAENFMWDPISNNIILIDALA